MHNIQAMELSTLVSKNKVGLNLLTWKSVQDTVLIKKKLKSILVKKIKYVYIYIGIYVERNVHIGIHTKLLIVVSSVSKIYGWW